jgi:hypothetical protein
MRCVVRLLAPLPVTGLPVALAEDTGGLLILWLQNDRGSLKVIKTVTQVLLKLQNAEITKQTARVL